MANSIRLFILCRHDGFYRHFVRHLRAESIGDIAWRYVCPLRLQSQPEFVSKHVSLIGSAVLTNLVCSLGPNAQNTIICVFVCVFVLLSSYERGSSSHAFAATVSTYTVPALLLQQPGVAFSRITVYWRIEETIFGILIWLFVEFFVLPAYASTETLSSVVLALKALASRCSFIPKFHLSPRTPPSPPLDILAWARSLPATSTSSRRRRRGATTTTPPPPRTTTSP